MLELLRLLFTSAWTSAHTWADNYDIKKSTLVLGIVGAVVTVLIDQYAGHSSDPGYARKIAFAVGGAIATPLLVFCVLFLIGLWYAPSTVVKDIRQTSRKEQRLTDEVELKSVKDRLTSAQRRIRELVQQLPMPSLTDQQRNDLIAALALLPRQTVSLNYLEGAEARNGSVVQILEDAFSKANWHLLRYPRSWDSDVFKRGLTIRLESGMATSAEAAVIRAFDKAHINLNRGCCPEWPRDKSADVEIIVGEM